MEHGNHANLLPPVHLQLVDLRDRQREHAHVEHDVERDVAEADLVQVEALPLVLPVPARPEVREGAALGEAEDHEGEADEHVEDLHQPEDPAEASLGEDAQEEEQDRGFDDGQADEVEEFENEEELHACPLASRGAP